MPVYDDFNYLQYYTVNIRLVTLYAHVRVLKF